MSALRPLLLLALSALLVAGCSSPGPTLPPAWQGRDLTQPDWSNHTVQGDWSFGLEYPLAANATVSWDWVSLRDAPTYFRIVYVTNGQAFPVGGQHNNAGRGNYTARVEGTYYFVWDYDGLPTTQLFYRLPEGGIPHDWPPGFGPGCAATLC